MPSTATDTAATASGSSTRELPGRRRPPLGTSEDSSALRTDHSLPLKSTQSLLKSSFSGLGAAGGFCSGSVGTVGFSMLTVGSCAVGFSGFSTMRSSGAFSEPGGRLFHVFCPCRCLNYRFADAIRSFSNVFKLCLKSASYIYYIYYMSSCLF